MRAISPNDFCPCGSNKKYKKCCRPYHAGLVVPTPEALVRARFSAYAIADVDFIMETTHKESPSYEANQERWRAHLAAYCLRNFYAKLVILSAEADRVVYEASILEFGENLNRYTEDCTFKQEGGRWLYVDGKIEPLPSV